MQFRPHPRRGRPRRAAGGPRPEADLWDLLLLHSSHRPLLLAVDDVELASTPSRQWLQQLGRRIDRLPVLLVVTERRRPEPGSSTAGFARTLPAPLVRCCPLGPLGRDAVAAWAARRLPARPAALLVAQAQASAAEPRTGEQDGAPAAAAPTADTLVDGFVRATGGNPLLLDALLTDLAALPDDRARLAAAAGIGAGPAPPAFADAVNHSLHREGPAKTATAAGPSPNWTAPQPARACRRRRRPSPPTSPNSPAATPYGWPDGCAR